MEEERLDQQRKERNCLNTALIQQRSQASRVSGHVAGKVSAPTRDLLVERVVAEYEGEEFPEAERRQ